MYIAYKILLYYKIFVCDIFREYECAVRERVSTKWNAPFVQVLRAIAHKIT